MNSKRFLFVAILLVICNVDLFSCKVEQSPVLWSYPFFSKDFLLFTNPITVDGVLYIFSQISDQTNSHLLGFDKDTGNQVCDIADNQLQVSPWLHYNHDIQSFASQFEGSSGNSFYHVYDVQSNSVSYSYEYSPMEMEILTFKNLVVAAQFVPNSNELFIFCASPIDLTKVFWNISIPSQVDIQNMKAVVSDVDQTTYFYYTPTLYNNATIIVAVDIKGNTLWKFNYDLLNDDQLLVLSLTYDDMLLAFSSKYVTVIQNQKVALRIPQNNHIGVHTRTDLESATLYYLANNQLAAFNLKNFQIIFNSTFTNQTWETTSMSLEKDLQNNTIVNIIQYIDTDVYINSVDKNGDISEYIFQFTTFDDITFFPNDIQSSYDSITEGMFGLNITATIGAVSTSTDFTFSFLLDGPLNF